VRIVCPERTDLDLHLAATVPLEGLQSTVALRARQGRLDEAMDLYDSLCARAGPLGLLPEQIAPASGAFLGTCPQAFSHSGVISSGVNLARLLQTHPPTRTEPRRGRVRG